MTLRIISVGRIKEKFFRDAADEFIKRLSRFCTVECVEVSDEKAPQRLSDAEREQVRRREGEKLLAKLTDEYVIALDMRGEELSSPELAKKLKTLMDGGKSKLAFVIGGSLGLCESVRRRADYILSFSKFTFAHQLMRVIVLEQLYRAFSINAGLPYHK